MSEQRARSVTDEWTYWRPDYGEEEADAQPVVVRQWDPTSLKFTRRGVATDRPEYVAELIAEEKHSDWDWFEEVDVMVKHVPSGTAWHVHVSVESRPVFSGRCQGGPA